MRQPTDEDLQRHIAKQMGITWEAYCARCEGGVRIADRPAWPTRPSIKFQWRPDRYTPTVAYDEDWDRFEDKLLQADRAHNAKILASIPKTEPEVASDPLTLAVREWGHEGMSVKFLNAPAIEILGMRGYKPVFDNHENPVRVGRLYMCEIPQEQADARSAYLAKEAKEAESATWYLTDSTEWIKGNWEPNDVFRITWRVWGWRGVFALYELRTGGKTKRGFELQTQHEGHMVTLRRLGLYK